MGGGKQPPDPRQPELRVCWEEVGAVVSEESAAGEVGEDAGVGGGAAADGQTGWWHQLGGCEHGQTPGDSRGQRSLAGCSPWVAKRRTPLSS